MEDAAHMVLRVLGLLVLDVVLFASLIAIPIGLPGTFVIAGAAVVTLLATGGAHYGWVAVIVMAALAVLGEVIESFLGPAVAGRYGATKWGMAGAFLGGIAGAVLGTALYPVVGTVIGSFIGTAFGAPLLEWSRGASGGEGARAGFGAFLGKGVASAIKLAFGMAMAIYIVMKVH